MLPNSFRPKRRRGVVGIVEDVRGGLVDGHGARVGAGPPPGRRELQAWQDAAWVLRFALTFPAPLSVGYFTLMLEEQSPEQ